MNAPKTAHPLKPRILITGDIVVDHHLYRGEREWPSDTKARATIEVTELGGAALIHQLLNHGAGDESKPWQAWLGLKSDLALYPDCYAVWEPCPKTPKGAKDGLVWRATEACGYGDGSRPQSAPDICGALLNPLAPKRAEIVVVDDAGLGFRDREKCWPSALFGSDGRRPWLVWKMSGALGRGSLWERLKDNAALLQRTILVLSANDLRRAELAIGRGLSWERTALDTARELAAPSVRALCRCRHVVVSFESAGALWADFTAADRPQFTLIYDAQRIEGDPAQSVSGGVFGIRRA